ncbi:MAG: hypothetical protein N4A35_06125 [Flavobacteriales bacterium]|jgi:hypothetical protein|nr:hypothetical protein [Flavobacteriales bacterium]
MKITFVYILAFALLLIGCKKNDRAFVSENDQLIPYDETPAHCYNNTLDDGELDIDCGGECPVCNEATPTCTLDLNTALVSNNPKQITNISKTQLPGGTIQISFNTGSMPCKIKINPDYTKLSPFNLVTGGYVAIDQMSLELLNPVYNYIVLSTYTENGEGFINTSTNGQNELIICNSTYASGNYSISLRLLIP